MTRPTKTWKQRLVSVVKLSIFVGLCWFLYDSFVSGNKTLAEHSWHADPLWLIISGVLYLSGMLPMSIFWQRVLRRTGQNVGVFEAVRAYFVSQLGKYVPGKLMVIVMRRSLLYTPATETTVVAATVFFETFFMLAVGAGMSAFILTVWFTDHPLLIAAAVGSTALLGIPALPSVFRWLMNVLRVGKLNAQAVDRFAHLGPRTLILGVLICAMGWLLQGASLWATLRAMDAARGGIFTDLSLHTAAVALGVAAGFISQLPGGLGMREMISAELMEPVYGADVALISAIIYRLVLLVSELVISTILYVIGWRRPHPSVAEVEAEMDAAEGAERRASRGKSGATPFGSSRSLALPGQMLLSVVIPVFDERESLEALHGELRAVAGAHGYDMEIVIVDDGSRDGSWSVIRRLAEQDPRTSGIRFRRNFGKAAALSAGFRASQGEMVMTLDADLQDDPHEIPRFLAAMSEELDVVSGWKKVRHDPWHKVLPSRVFNGAVSWLTGVRLHDHNCGMKCYRRSVLREVRLYGELHRFVPVLAAARGFEVGELVIAHRPRKFGHSKYGFRRFVKGFLDLLTVKFLTGFGQRPQHLLGAIGLLSFATGLIALSILAAGWVAAQLHPEWNFTPLHQRPAVIYSMGALLLGGQLMSIGFLAELITAYQFRESDTYSIAERTVEHADKTTTTP